MTVPAVVREQFLAAEVLRLQDENRRLEERIRLLSQVLSRLAAGPVDAETRQEEHA